MKMMDVVAEETFDPTGVYCEEHPTAPLSDAFRTADHICSEGGLVVADIVIGTADPSRVGGPELCIGKAGKREAPFDEFGAAKHRNRRTGPAGAHALSAAFREIGRMADGIKVPQHITERANKIFQLVYKTRNLKRRPIDAIASASLYIACREEGVPRTFKEIGANSHSSKKNIGSCFKLILTALQIDIDLLTAGDFVPRFCSNLGLSPTVQKAATTIARRAVELDIAIGRSPSSVAAAAIYMASQASATEEKKTRKIIRDVSSVTENTIGKVYTLMYPRAQELFPYDFEFITPIEQLPRK